MRRNITLIFAQRTAKAFTVNQLRVQFARHQLVDGFAHVFLIWLVAEDTQVQLLLKLLGQRRPVGAHGFQPFKHHPLFVALLNQSGVALFAAGIGPANGWHQKTAEMGFILQFQCAGQPLFLQRFRPPGVNVLHQCTTDFRCFFFRMCTFQPDKR
ncbi:Uncharacterised protein [Klebsiella pneumoniae]|nr:Uncharacterised protein [Klebsiella pneumoniae]